MDLQFSKYSLKKSQPYDIPEPEYLWPAPLVDNAPEQAWGENDDVYYHRWTDHIFNPALYSFIAPEGKRTGQAVVVCPGGGYHGCCFDKEGTDVARLLNANGISAFVLNYRDGASPSGEEGIWPEGPLTDALRAIRMVRSRASMYGIDPHKIGIMGFSSGGHLTLTASTLYDSVKEEDPKWSGISARPDFTIAIYPVCSFISEKQHRGSVIRLLGGHSTMDQLLRFSPERNVTKDTPQAYLVHAANDDGVPCENSLLYFQALLAQGIPAELHIYPDGGHGFGMFLHGMSKDCWEEQLIHWLQTR